MFFSEEQLKIIKSDKKNIVVNAGPGSGKTTLLLGITKERTDRKHLILCFNSSIKEEIKNKIEKEKIKNADVYTFHSLAFNFFLNNKQYINNFSKRDFSENLDFFTMFNIMKKLNIINSYEDEKLLTTLNMFKNYLTTDKKIEEVINDVELRDNIKKILTYLVKDKEAPMFHEVYIKIFQLLKPKVSYDSILVDEFQDVSACYLSIINNISKDKYTIRVGDTYQKIYGYNGALGMNECDFKLTQSFRIGEEIGIFCNDLLNTFFKNPIKLKGKNLNQKIEKINKKKSFTKIYRTNKQLIIEMLKFIKEGKKVKVSNKIINLINLFDYLIRVNKFGNYNYKGIEVRSLFEIQLLFLISKDSSLDKFFFINEYFSKEEMIELFNNCRNLIISEDEEKEYDIHLITAHRCKGLEFESVLIADDFIPLKKMKEKILKEDFTVLDEVYILFVTLTRSFGTLELNKDLKNFFNKEGI